MRLWKGRKVEIWNATCTKKLGIGMYIGSERCYLTEAGKEVYIGWTPKFKLGKKVICGFECWWIPVSETK